MRRPRKSARAIPLFAAAILFAAPATAWKIDPDLLAACPILGQAISMANQIVNGSEGVDCFLHGPLDQGMDPEGFDDDGEGPEIKIDNLDPGTYGEYRHLTDPNTIFIDEQLKLDVEHNPALLMVLAATIVHETTHWVDHTADGGHDTPLEEGCAMETWIFGYPKWIENAMGTTLCQVSAQGDLAIALSAPKTKYLVGEPIDLQVKLTNRTSKALSFLDLLSLPAGFLSFSIRTPSGRIAPYLGVEGKARPHEDDVVMLQPGQSITRTVRINSTTNGYAMKAGGGYQITAQFAEPNFGCPLYGRSDYFIGNAKSGTISLSLLAPVAVGPAGRGIPRNDD